LSALIREAASRTALSNGVRIGLCLAVATAITVTMHQPAHSFWLPLTTAVIVRPEYASVFVRTVNRVFGTVIGALLATGLLAVLSTGIPLVVATALAVGFVVLSAPKLYGLSVIGVTASALLSQSIGHADPGALTHRLVDTLIGAAVAVVFGYLLWPGARRFPASTRLSMALPAAHSYFSEAVKPARQRRHWQSCRDDAYRLAHRVRATAEAAVLEPPTVSFIALQAIPAAIELEDTVDAITAVGSAELALQITLVITSVLVVLLVLLHRAKGGGLSTLFGGGVQSSLSGSTVVEKNLDRLTLFVTGIWLVCIVGVALLVKYR
jgi:protein translocase SecG subunit